MYNNSELDIWYMSKIEPHNFTFEELLDCTWNTWNVDQFARLGKHEFYVGITIEQGRPALSVGLLVCRHLPRYFLAPQRVCFCKNNLTAGLIHFSRHPPFLLVNCIMRVYVNSMFGECFLPDSHHLTPFLMIQSSVLCKLCLTLTFTVFDSPSTTLCW